MNPQEKKAIVDFINGNKAINDFIMKDPFFSLYTQRPMVLQGCINNTVYDIILPTTECPNIIIRKEI
jgi:hypothetical protein